MLHEAFDAAHALAGQVAESLRDDALLVEAQAIFGATGHEMQVAAHAPQEFLAAMEQVQFSLGEDAGCDELFRLAHAIDIF